MKRNFPFFVLSSCLILSCNSETIELDTADAGIETTMTNDDINEAVDEKDRILSIASGQLSFEYSGSWTGTETVWFDQYGKRVVMDQDIHFSAKNHQKTRLIWIGQKDGSYTCNYLNDAGEEEKSCFAPAMRPKDTELSMFVHGDETQLQYTYSPTGPKTIVGKVAKGWKSKSSAIEGWIWRGIDLMYDNQGVRKELQTIKKIDAIPADLLKLPEGFSLD